MNRLRALFFICLALVLGGFTLVLTASETNAAVRTRDAAATALNAPDARILDHFWCYQTNSTPVDKQIGLQDQFTTAVIPHLVGPPTHLCNPAKKRHGDNISDIIDRNAHLMLYEIGAPTARILKVEVRNQFGTRVLKVFGPAKAVAVPTQKNNHEAPTDLDHFKCYRVKGESALAVVSLKDQFQRAGNLAVGRPIMLCNPALKVHGANTFPILHPKAHLVCYKITVVPFQINVQTKNQFRAEPLAVGNPNMLCVPSKKKILTI